MPRHQATPIRRGPGCLWARGGCRLGTLALAITLEGLIEKASQILDLAIAEKQFSAAVAALQELGTLSGLRVERREVGRPGEFEQLSADLRH